MLWYSVTLLLIFVFVNVNAESLCRNGWVKAEESCVKFFKDAKVQWFEAAFNCYLEGGILVSIDSQSKQDFISKYLTGHTDLKRNYLIGGHERNKQWSWMSLSGKLYKQTFQNWLPGEPNNYNGGEDCAIMVENSLFQWNDVPCSTSAVKFPYICEVGFDYGEDIIG